MMLNKLSLNTIGLNRIGLNRIGKPSRGSSGRPYIDPEVLASLKAVCICYGKSNDDPDRAIVKNLVDPDNPFIISNAAYKLNSGYGKYSADFESFDWTVGISQKQHNKATISLNSRLCNHAAIEVDEMKVNIIGNVTELIYWYIANPDDTARSEIRLTSGINTLPKSYAKDDGQTYNIGFAYISGDSEITIEQIPSYQGAFVTDGIDDLITSTKTVQDMLGGSTEFTAVSMIHLTSVGQDVDGNAYTNYIRTSDNYWVSNRVSNTDKTGIYGYSFKQGTLTVINNILGDKNDYTAEKGDDVSEIFRAKFSVEGFEHVTSGAVHVSSVAWYWTIIANKVLTTDQINQVIAYYNLDRCVEPTVWYDVQKQGLSNDTPDSDWYLKDYSGNGYDMTLYNYAKTPESGINEGGGLQSDGVDDYGKVTGLPIYKDYTVVASREFIGDHPGAVASKSYTGSSGSFYFESGDSVASFGAVNRQIIKENIRISYLSKYVYNGDNVQVGTADDSDKMWIGVLRDNDNRYSNIAIYSLMTFPYSMSEFLIERQLKKHKLGTLYPDMVEWRPIYTSNVNDYTITKATYFDETAQHDLALGNHYPIGTRFRIYVKPSGAVDEVTSIKVNGVELTYDYIDSNYGYAFNGTLSSKSPQKIDITIDEYIRYEDIDFTSAYPFVPIIEGYTWGDKLKVGDKVTYKIWSNVLPDLYSRRGEMKLNGENILSNSSIAVEKSMKFEMNKVYLKSNEPKCILSPSRLRIPNSSYKILGYIPDISGHGNHGKINNSAYAEGSGVNADGSYQLDGVDDFITIPTLTNSGKQILMKINWNTEGYNKFIADFRGVDGDRYYIVNELGPTVSNLAYQNANKTYIDGIFNNNIKGLELKGITHNITSQLASVNSSPYIGARTGNGDNLTMALYDFMLFDEISTDEEILTLNEYVGIEGNTDDLFTENN